MNLPNRLTVGRLFLTMFFVMALSTRFPFHYTVALVLFVVAGITDFVDGEIARRYGMVTDFGKLMDPLIDKVMTAAAFVSLVPLGAIPAWVAIVVISREFLITGLRLLAVSKNRVLAADPIGKHKTAWQFATVIFFLVLLSAYECHGSWPAAGSPGPLPVAVVRLRELWAYGGFCVSSVAVILTVYSGVDYFWRHWALLEME
jgi:CDP-diacylglycerol--glycerol-3-phosphate 3-phosphatidyltransferase